MSQVNKFAGDKRRLVWAKLRYCPYWPARIVDPPKEIGPVPRNKVCVFFFGSKNYGFAQNGNVVDYEANRTKYLKKGQSRGGTFNDAVEQIEEFLNDPITFTSNANPNNNDIVVKSERSSFVKTEKEIDETPYEMEIIPSACISAEIEAMKKEKEGIIRELVVIKGENQKLALQLQQKQRQIDKQLNTSSVNAQKLANNIQSLTTDVADLKRQLEAEKCDHANDTKKVADLLREKKMLLAQIAELQCVKHKCQTKLSAENKENYSCNDEYEVEDILDHRILKRDRKFLVAWKGFSRNDDTWEREKNLNCPDILTAYLKKHGLNCPQSQ